MAREPPRVTWTCGKAESRISKLKSSGQVLRANLGRFAQERASTLERENVAPVVRIDSLKGSKASIRGRFVYADSRKAQALFAIEDVHQQHKALLAAVGQEDPLNFREWTLGNTEALAGQAGFEACRARGAVRSSRWFRRDPEPDSR